MFTPAMALRFKRFRRRYGVLSPKVVVRTGFSRKTILALLVLVFVLLLVLVWYLRAGGLGESRQLTSLRVQLSAQQQELNMLRSTAGTGKNLASMEKAAQTQLLDRLRELEAENAELKEDMLIFERLVPVVGQGSPARIESFRAAKEAPTRYRYRLLLAYQPAQRGAEFRGAYQLHARYSLGGTAQQKIYPDIKGVSVEMRHFLRREGVIELPPGAELVSLELRLLQDGKLLGKQEARM